MITLFSERPEQVQKPYTFAASILLHIFGSDCWLLESFPRQGQDPSARSFGRAHLDLHSLEARCSGPSWILSIPDSSKKHTLPQAEHGSAAGYASGSTSTAGLRRCCSGYPKPVTLAEKIPCHSRDLDGKKSPEKRSFRRSVKAGGCNN